MLVALETFEAEYDGEVITLHAVHPLKVQTLVSKPAQGKPNAKSGFLGPGGESSGSSKTADG